MEYVFEPCGLDFRIAYSGIGFNSAVEFDVSRPFTLKKTCATIVAAEQSVKRLIHAA